MSMFEVVDLFVFLEFLRRDARVVDRGGLENR